MMSLIDMFKDPVTGKREPTRALAVRICHWELAAILCGERWADPDQACFKDLQVAGLWRDYAKYGEYVSLALLSHAFPEKAEGAEMCVGKIKWISKLPVPGAQIETHPADQQVADLAISREFIEEGGLTGLVKHTHRLVGIPYDARVVEVFEDQRSNCTIVRLKSASFAPLCYAWLIPQINAIIEEIPQPAPNSEGST